ncbi:MAG: methyltransferase domain-containing protein [Chloroflexi bacterium]|nr:methyltransferase domain-containing protein [Chloroflexota bacterium]
MKSKTLKRLGFLAGIVLAIWLWQRERDTSDISRRLERATIRLSQSARLVQGRERATWVRRFYALLAPAYDLLFLKLPGYQQAARDLIDRLDVGAHDAALDVGCGTGLLTLPLAERAGRVVGLDLSPSMLRKLAAKAARRDLNIELRQGSVLELPFADEEFTVVTTAFMLLYLTPDEKQRAMAEIRRVLAPGGRLGCLSSPGEIADVFLTREEWEALLHEAGFTDVQIEERREVFRLIIARRGDGP